VNPTPIRCLVVAKAPLPGRSKTRLGVKIGMERAAVIAAAALLDTLTACSEAFGAKHCYLALEGDLGSAVDGSTINSQLRDWTVFGQRGDSLAERLVSAYCDIGSGPVIQVGMDTPQVDSEALHEVAAGLMVHQAVLGPAKDGGWWVLALRDPSSAAVLADVPMSTDHTFKDTYAVLVASGLDVGTTRTLCDVDTVTDAVAVAVAAPHTRFAGAWSAVRDTTMGVSS
jgi:uncharacterized protein